MSYVNFNPSSEYNVYNIYDVYHKKSSNAYSVTDWFKNKYTLNRLRNFCLF